MSAKNIKTHAEQELQTALVKAIAFVDQLSDGPEYRNLLLALFFLKRISDEWDLQHDARKLAESGSPSGAGPSHPVLPYQLPPTSRFEHLYLHRHESGNAQRLFDAFRGLERANMSLFCEMFDDFCLYATNVESRGNSDPALGQLIEIFGTPEFDLSSDRFPNPRVIGLAFTFLLEQLVGEHGKSMASNFTPTSLAELVACLVAPKEAETIYDPFCGTGSLLLTCAEQAEGKHEDDRQYALIGQESNHEAWSLSKINLFLNNQLNHRVLLGDSIRSPQFVDTKGKLKHFDVVVSHAPFSVSNWGHEIAKDDPYGRFPYGVPPRSRGDYAFIQHMLGSLDPGHGRLAVIVSLGVLYRGGADAEIRQRIIEDNLLDTVIVLPERLLPNTGIPIAVLVFRSNKTDQDVLFIDASKECQSGRRKNKLAEANITKIVGLFQKRESHGAESHLASFEEIKKNDFNCSIQRYVRPPTDDEVTDFATLKHQEQALMQEITALNQLIDSDLEELGYNIKGAMH